MSLAVLLGAACGNGAAGPDAGPDAEPSAAWKLVHNELPGALMAIWGSSSSDVWVVGADPDDGLGPYVLHYNGTAWSRKRTGATGDLWWVHGFAGGPIFMGGKGGLLLRYADGAFETMSTPGLGTIFGVWGATPEEMWAVGGGAGGASGAFAWRLTGEDTWVQPEDFPAAISEDRTLWKVFGRSADDVWLVGTRGVALHYDGESLEEVPSDTDRALFTVHASSERFVAVGGYGTGTIIENDGSGWRDVSDPALLQVIGVYMVDGGGYAVGIEGVVYRRTDAGWVEEVTGLAIYDQLHAVWIDPDGGVWAVGGQTVADPLIRGVLMYKGNNELPGEIYVEE